MDQRMGGTHPKGGCRHYLGKSKDVAKRLETHRAGKGARMLAAAVERGISFDVVRTWDGDVERQLKALHNAPRLCPVHGVTS
jgi:predicted GIY-YIG superfamily endonuclease